MLIREMGHRVKNAFAVMGGLVSLSARSAATPEALARQIQARLAALTRAQDLTRPSLLNSESTPGQSMTFHALVHAIFAPFLNSEVSTERERLIVKGPDVPIAEKSVTGLALLARTRNECGQVWLPVIRKGLRPHQLVYVEWPISRDMGGEGRTPA